MAGILGCLLHAQGLEPTRKQSLDLQQGWNAGFLELDPVDSTPAGLTAGTAIEVVTEHRPALAPGR